MSLVYNFNNNGNAALSDGECVAYYNETGSARIVRFISGAGTKLFLNYGDLESGFYSPEDGTIILTFAAHIVTLTGHRLETLFDRLSTHSVSIIKATDERYAAADETAPLVTDIRVDPA